MDYCLKYIIIIIIATFMAVNLYGSCHGGCINYGKLKLISSIPKKKIRILYENVMFHE